MRITTPSRPVTACVAYRTTPARRAGRRSLSGSSGGSADGRSQTRVKRASSDSVPFACDRMRRRVGEKIIYNEDWMRSG